MPDLKLSENEYAGITTALTSFGSVAESILARYLFVLHSASTKGVSGGITAQNLVRFFEKASHFEGKIEELTTTMATELRGYVSEIDACDRYLY